MNTEGIHGSLAHPGFDLHCAGSDGCLKESSQMGIRRQVGSDDLFVLLAEFKHRLAGQQFLDWAGFWFFAVMSCFVDLLRENLSTRLDRFPLCTFLVCHRP